MVFLHGRARGGLFFNGLWIPMTRLSSQVQIVLRAAGDLKAVPTADLRILRLLFQTTPVTTEDEQQAQRSAIMLINRELICRAFRPYKVVLLATTVAATVAAVAMMLAAVVTLFSSLPHS
jgi:hypothetical protein